jgi:hypothetical protein
MAKMVPHERITPMVDDDSPVVRQFWQVVANNPKAKVRELKSRLGGRHKYKTSTP